jgi:glutathione S-transferase
VKLYYKSGACPLAPHIVLEELGLPYEAEVVDLKTKLTASGKNYLLVNAKGYVPALELDDGTVLTEGPAIVQYLADLKPEKKLAPANGSLERYKLQAWLTFVGTELHKQFSPIFNSAAPEEWKELCRATLVRRLTWVDGELAGKDYLMGADFSVADAYLFTVLRWTAAVKVDISAMANIAAFRTRVAARSAVQAAMKAEGLPA